MWDAAGRRDAKGRLRWRPTKGKRRWRSSPRSTRCIPVTDGFCGKCGAPMEPGCQARRRSIAGSIARRRSNAAIAQKGACIAAENPCGTEICRTDRQPEEAGTGGVARGGRRGGAAARGLASGAGAALRRGHRRRLDHRAVFSTRAVLAARSIHLLGIRVSVCSPTVIVTPETKR